VWEENTQLQYRVYLWGGRERGMAHKQHTQRHFVVARMYYFKDLSKACWYTPIISATQEADMGGSRIQG
jgi:hypothetical protein